MRVAMPVSGCGSGGGSQIEEFILTYLALDTYGLDYNAAARRKCTSMSSIISRKKRSKGPKEMY